LLPQNVTKATSTNRIVIIMKTKLISWLVSFAFCLFVCETALGQDNKKPNILVIMGDDIGWFSPSCYNRGMMGSPTPNIDRIAKEGAMLAL
jgi:arylsulfatase